jgi:uncharacterized membrane protein
MKNLKLIFGILFIVIVFFSCQKDSSTTPVDIGYGYIPEKTGYYIVYDCDSVAYNSFTNKIDSFKFQIKEVIESYFLDNANRNTQRIERYRKNYSATVPYNSMQWVLKDVWYANKTNTTFERVEENQRFCQIGVSG